MAERFVLPVETAFDANGNPISGAKLNFYLTGTSTRADTYSDSGLTTPNANPVVADSAGRFGSIFLGAGVTYKVVFTDASDVTIWTRDPVAAPASVSEATQAQVDARTATTVYVSPAKIADGAGLQGASIASAAALTLPTVGDYFSVSGTTSITSISSRSAGREITLVFAAALTLTHNATSLILPGAANVTTAAGDSARLRSEGSGNWRCVGYTKASGLSVVAPIFTKSFTSSQQAVTAGGQLVLAHGLGAMPALVQVRLKCVTAEWGYSVGDEVIINPGENNDDSASSRGLSLVPDATNLTIRFGSSTSSILIMQKDTGARNGITNANWKLIVRAWA